MEARGIDDRVDRVTWNLFGFRRKSPPEKFSSDGGGGGRNPAADDGQKRWERWREMGRDDDDGVRGVAVALAGCGGVVAARGGMWGRQGNVRNQNGQMMQLIIRKMLLCKQEKAGFRLNVEQADWRDDIDDEPEDQELDAHYLYMAQIQEVTPDNVANSGPTFDDEPLQKVQINDDNSNLFAIESEHLEQHLEQPEYVNDTYPVEQDEHNIIIDSLDMSYDREQDNQDENDDLAKERDLLASLIKKLKCEIDDNKNRNKFLETSNKALVDKLKGEIEDFNTKNKNLESSNNHFKEANNELSKTNQLMLKDLKKFQAELDRYHDVNYASKVAIDCAKAKGDLMEYYYVDHMNAILGVYTTLDEFTYLQCDYVDQVVKCERLEKELSKNLKAQLKDKGIAISELKKLIEKMKGKYVETKFEKSLVIRQPNAFKSQRQSVLGKPATFSYSLAKTDFSKSKSVTTNNVSNDFSKPVTIQILPQNVMSILKNTNVIALGIYKVHTKPNQTRTPQLPQDIRKTNKHVSFSTGVIPTTSVSRPKLKSNQLEDRVMPNNSQWKKQEVEDHRRNFKFLNNKTTKMPMVVPISTREPKQTVNQSVATPHRRTVTLGSTNQNQEALLGSYMSMLLVGIILFIIDSGCSKHMMGNLKLLSNFMEKFLDLEVAFQKSTYYIRELKGNDILIGSRGTDLYSITLQDTSTPNPICLMAKASSSQAWLWHRRLSYLNFDSINLLSKNDIVNGLPKLKFVKDHLCSSCSIPINRGLIQAIPISLPPQPIGETTKASNLQRIPPRVQGRSHFTYFLHQSDCDSEDIEEEVEYKTDDEVVMSEQEETNHGYTQNIQHFEENDNVDEWLNSEITKHMSMQGVKNIKDALISIIKSIRQEMKDGIMKRQFETLTASDKASSIASNKVGRAYDNTLPCRLPNELSPGSFLLPFNINNHNLYATTTLDAKDISCHKEFMNN
ncbi:retrovirus-related pol polyprotein from transposon TNT 1-94 [Tanacetum coccineum]